MSEENKENQFDVNEVKDGTAVVHVRNLDLAVCLLSVGVPLRKDPPYTHLRLKNGEDQWTFNFDTTDSDGQFNTSDLIAAFKEDMKFIDENPVHPFTFAMCALKNLDSFKRHMLQSVPYVGFRAQGGATLFVKEGSKKYRNCKAKGMVQI